MFFRKVPPERHPSGIFRASSLGARVLCLMLETPVVSMQAYQYQKWFWREVAYTPSGIKGVYNRYRYDKESGAASS